MTRLVLIRHGESEWNVERRIQGQSGSGLSERGHRQAEAVAAWVADTHPSALVFASDLQRCQETVVPIARALGDVDVTDEVDLRERRFGEWEGLTHPDIEIEHAELYARWIGGADIIEEVGGESGLALAERAVKVFYRLTDVEADVVIAVTHGGTIWHGLHQLLDLPFPTLGGVGNTSVTEVVRHGDRWFLDTWNQQAHLPAELRTSGRPAEQRAKR